jgi:hypothetical protein
MLDDSDFRLGVPGINGKMRVKEADQNTRSKKTSLPPLSKRRRKALPPTATAKKSSRKPKR